MLRRNRLAREYSVLAQERRDAAERVMERDAAALRMAREIVENAPPGLVYLTLTADMRGLMLHANGSVQGMFVGAAKKERLLGRCVYVPFDMRCLIEHVWMTT